MATVKGIEVSGITYDIEDETSRSGVETNESAIGTLSDLETTVKTDLVSAINNVNSNAFSEEVATFNISGSWQGSITAIRHKSLVAIQLTMDDKSLSPSIFTCTISNLSTFFNNYQKCRGILFTNGGVSCGTFSAISATTIQFIFTYDSSGDDEGFDPRITMVYDPE